MSRSEEFAAGHGHGETYYHGTNKRMRPGQKLRAATALSRGGGEHYSEDPAQEWRASRVGATKDPYEASHWGQHVYEVQLHGPAMHQAEEYDWHRAEFGNPDGQFHAPSGVVVRRVPKRQIEEPR